MSTSPVVEQLAIGVPVERLVDETKTTVIPTRPADETQQQRRALNRISRQDVMTMLGAALSALCTTVLIFGRLTPLSGTLGFIIASFLIFVGTYAVLLSMAENRPAVVDRVMTALMAGTALVAMVALFSVVFFTFAKGWEALNPVTHRNTYVDDLSVTGPQDGLDRGGVAHAIVGTLIIMMLTLIYTVPLGLTCAVYLNESRGRLAELVRTVVTAMTALPSILAGLFIFSTLILTFGFERSGFAASIAVSIVMLPIIIRAADVVLRLVPGSLREASSALGSPQWRTVWHVVLPTARSGLTTAVILGVARGVGETAPILLTAGLASSMNLNPFKGPMAALPLTAFDLASKPLAQQVARGFATASVLMIMVLLLFAIARVLGGRPVGRLSKRQMHRAQNRSRKDLERIRTHHREMAA